MTDEHCLVLKGFPEINVKLRAQLSEEPKRERDKEREKRQRERDRDKKREETQREIKREKRHRERESERARQIDIFYDSQLGIQSI